jgi:exodeoxyribonuclease VII large subunit
MRVKAFSEGVGHWSLLPSLEDSSLRSPKAGEAVRSEFSTVPKVLSVSELNRLVRRSLEDLLPAVWVRGEISNFTRAASGHMYFSLKDEDAVVRCVLFRQHGLHLPREFGDGEQVLLGGRVTIYERSGQYQIVATALEVVGRGVLAARFEELKEKLRLQGLFAAERKRQLPGFVTTVGVVTSPDGAAIRDIVKVATGRFPGITVVLSPAQVQGEGAATMIVRALDALVRDGRAQVIIVGRGGGSLEDLWPFNEEVVAHAIHRCPIPVVSAVGHEIDFTIADFVADVRAPTPSAAAELVVPDAGELGAAIERLRTRLVRALSGRLHVLEEMTRRLAEAHGLRRAADVLLVRQQRCDDIAIRLRRAVPSALQRVADRLSAVEEQLMALSPRAILDRGYSVTRLLPDRDIVSDVRQLTRGDLVDILFARGGAVCSVKECKAREE